MARITYSALVDSVSGSMNGSTFQRSAYGHTLKGKGYPRSAITSARQSQRVLIDRAVHAWASLNLFQQSWWQSYAQLYPTFAKHNKASQLNAYNLFVKYHVARMMCGDDTILTNPTIDHFEFSFVRSFMYNTSGTALDFVFEFLSNSADWIAVLEVSDIVPPGRKRDPKGTRIITPLTIAFPDPLYTFNADITSPYLAKYPRLPQVGDFVSAKGWIVHTECAQFVQLNIAPYLVEPPPA